MFLLASDVPCFLLSRGLLTAGDIAGDGLRVREVRRRNRSFRVSGIDGPGLFIKQVAASAPDLAGTLAREAALHRLAETSASLSALRGVSVALRSAEERRGALVFDLFDGADTLDGLYRRTRRLDPSILALLGASLSAIHAQAEPEAAQIADRIGAQRQPPWILTIGRRDVPVLGQGGAQLIASIRATPAIVQALEMALARWRPRTLIQGDMKWDNILVRPGPDGAHDLRIVDWELADIGDPLWDAAGILSGFYSSWLVEDGRMPWMADANTPPRAPEPVPMEPLAALWPAMEAFWHAASGGDGFHGGKMADAVPYLGARLLQSAMESTFTSPTVPPLAAELVNLAGLALTDADRFMAEFMGRGRGTTPATTTPTAAASPLQRPPVIPTIAAHGTWADPALIAIAEAVRIPSPQSVQLAGLPPQMVTIPAGQDPRPALLDALWPLLYQHGYSRRWDGMPAGAPPLNLSADPAFCARLSAANAGRSVWDRGWTIYQIAPDGRLHVQKGDSYRAIAAAQANLPPGRSAQPGDRIDLAMPRESLTAQPGYYHAFGEAPTSAADEGDLARLYFNLSAEQAPVLLNLLTLGLNRYFIPFQLKCPSAPALYDRVDTLVLYPPRRYLPLVLDVLDGAVPVLAPLLRPGEPLFTQRLLPGLGGADDPGTGESFGQSRCRLLAAGIIDAWSGGGGLLDCIAARLTAAGLRPDGLHLSPGFADLYRPLRGRP